MTQSTNKILMIRPKGFRMNEQTAVNNYYQAGRTSSSGSENAQMEFDRLAALIAGHGIEVMVADPDDQRDTPDRLFPNNWMSVHEQKIVIYPMFAPNRRLERNRAVVDAIIKSHPETKAIIDLSTDEERGLFLEGTGSLVLDRIHRKAYASISERTDETLVRKWCSLMNYTPVIFRSYHSIGTERKPIYHTNVMMSIGEKFAVICSDCIDDKTEREMVRKSLAADGKVLIGISEAQVNTFCGNILEVKNASGEPFIIMSDSAFDGFEAAQRKQLESFGNILHSPLNVIETHGGGSARCMLAEIF